MKDIVKKREKFSKPIIGKYADIPLEEIRKYYGIHDYYLKLIEDIYNENSSTIPYDILLDMIDIVPYSEIENYFTDNEEIFGSIEMGYFEDNFDDEILNFNYSHSMKDLMKKYNILPYKKDYTTFYLLSPMVEEESYLNSPDKNLFISSLKKDLGLEDLLVEILYGTNKLFMDGAHYIIERKEYTIDNIKITSKEELEKIFIDSIILGASDIYWDPKKNGVSISLSILNDEKPYKRLYLSEADRKIFEVALLEMCGVVEGKENWALHPTRYETIKEFARIPTYTGRLQITANVDGSLSIVIRITDISKSVVPLEDLNISDTRKEELKKMIMNPSGIILIAGETGSGKTTTIYSVLQELKRVRPTSRIEEVSKSIEVKMDEISQIEIADNNEGLGFEEVLEAETRRNAKVLYLSEVNSPNSAKFAIDMAISSKLIITTIHTNKASFIPTRVRGITTNEKTLYKDFLESVVGLAHQVMLKEVCPNCKREVHVSTTNSIDPNLPEILKAYGYPKEKITVVDIDNNCPICNGSGFLIKNPIIAVETIIITEDIRQLLRENEENPILELDKYLLKNHTSGLDDALKYVAEGKVSINQVYNKYSMWNITKQLYIPKNNK